MAYLSRVFPDFLEFLTSCYRLGPLEANTKIRIHVNVFLGITKREVGKRGQRKEGDIKHSRQWEIWLNPTRNIWKLCSHVSELSHSGTIFKFPHSSHWLRAAPKKLQVLHTHGKKSDSLAMVL